MSSASNSSASAARARHFRSATLAPGRVGRARFLRQTEVVLHVADAADGFGDVLRAALRHPAVDGPGERHHAAAHRHVDVARVDIFVLRQPLADVFADAVVGSLVVLRTDSPEGRTYGTD